MDVQSNSSPNLAVAEVSFVRGGPFYRAQQAIRLMRPNQWNLGRRIPILIAVVWLPLVALIVVLNPTGLASLLGDYRVYSRFFLAIPVLLVGELLMESRFRAVMSHLRGANLLEAADAAYMDEVIVRLGRLGDSLLPEIGILVLLSVHTVASYKGLVDATPWLTDRAGNDLHLTAAGWYAVVVSTSIFQFLLGLGLWKWLLWTLFAFRLSTRELRLVPTHPDKHGGLGFLGLTASAFAPLAFAASVVIGATWRQEILHDGARLMSFKLPAIALVVIIALIALGPLAFFVPRLAALRRRGILEYGILGQIHSMDFHDKWIVHRAGRESEFLQALESSTLADFGKAYENIGELKPFPVDRGALVTLAVAVAAPALPVILTQVPLIVLLDDLLKALR
jgi:hypothetical protein